jgi:hypothetical protein
MNAERRLIAEQGKLDALRDRIVHTTYLKASEVRAHLNMSRHTLYALPPEVLPYVASESGERRYNPADVNAYPARARRLAEAKDRDAVLRSMRADLERRDAEAIERALEGAA